MYDATTNGAAICERSDWWSRCDRALTFLLALYLFFVSQILLTTSMKTMLRFLPQIDSFCTGVLGDRNNATTDKFLPCEFDVSETTPARTNSTYTPSRKSAIDDNTATAVVGKEIGVTTRRVVDASSAVAASTATLASYHR